MTAENEKTSPGLQSSVVEDLKPRLEKAVRFVIFIAGRMRDDQVNRVAASLSYTSTLALVPALALALAVLAAFPAFSGVRESVQDLVLSSFMPDTGMRMDEALEGFVSAAGQLTTIGIAGLIVTSVLLLLTIESAFNRIFRVPRMRPILARLVVFWTVITIGPLLLGLSFSLSGYFVTIQRLIGAGDPSQVTILIGTATPTIMTAIAFGLIYMAVPNRRVRFADALLGGAIAAVLFALLRFGFSSFIAGMPTYQAIYGAVAAVPVFLIWLFLSWTVILAGAVITAALPDWRRSEHERATGPGGRLALAMDVLSSLYDVAGSGVGLTQRAMRSATGVREAALIPILDELRHGGFVTIGDDNNWRLGRDLSRTPVVELIHLLGYGVPLTPDLSGRSESVSRLSSLLTDAQAREKQVLNVPVSSLFESRQPSVSASPRVVSV